ncbi:hypothetical protein ACFU8A_32555, partial [Streptomyces sp. NPDC057546]|uniref:hypothetical protein n=1 Tax=Streptomyces sp. NPDC057546 TaxID=3346165 RepID=UPI003683FF32
LEDANVPTPTGIWSVGVGAVGGQLAIPRLGGRARASPASGNCDRRVTEGTNAPPRRVPAHERALRAQERELESGHRRTAGDHARVFEGKT